MAKRKARYLLTSFTRILRPHTSPGRRFKTLSHILYTEYLVFGGESIDTKEKNRLAEELTRVIENAREGHKGYLCAAQNYYGMYPEKPLVNLKSEDEYIADRIIEFLEKRKPSKN